MNFISKFSTSISTVKSQSHFFTVTQTLNSDKSEENQYYSEYYWILKIRYNSWISLNFKRLGSKFSIYALGAGHKNVIVTTKGATNSLKNLAEPENIDEVEYNAGEDEQWPHYAQLAASRRTIDRVYFVPVGRNARDAR